MDDDIRLYNRNGLWYWCFAQDYSEGPFADGDDFGPFACLQDATVSIAFELSKKANY